jgi:septum site-determining protein MinD
VDGEVRLSSYGGKVVALVSGKGGSGKTMLAAAITQVLSVREPRVLLADFDLGTGGLSYYLGLKSVSRIRPGLTEFILEDMRNEPDAPRRDLISMSHVSGLIKKLQGRFGINADFLPIGDHRRLLRQPLPAERVIENLTRAISALRNLTYTKVVIDCRGGVDVETLAICQAVDEIILVVEPDTTSFQASQHLVDALSDARLADKLIGFVINKVFEDPTVIARQGSATFATAYLGAIPFDIETSRSFLIGELPSSSSPFSRQLDGCLAEAYPEIVPAPSFIMKGEDFNALRTDTAESKFGAALCAALILFLAIGFALTNWLRGSYVQPSTATVQFTIIALGGLLGAWSVTRRSAGRVVMAYLRLVRRLYVRR